MAKHPLYRLPDGTVAYLEMNDISTILRDKGLDPNGDVQRFHTANVLRRITRYMPYRSGMTIKVTLAQTNIDRPLIVTNTPYARMLFLGVVMVDPVTGAAGFKTADGWKSRRGVSKVPSDRKLTYDTSKNDRAGPRWDKALTAAEGKAMAADLQRYINARRTP